MTQHDIIAALDDCTAPLVVTHAHADLDTVGSAVGLVEALGGNAQIVLPDSVVPAAQQLLDQLSTPTVAAAAAQPEQADAVVVVDTPTADRVALVGVNRLDSPVVLIDHHETGDLLDYATATLIDTNAGSTAELVASVINDADWALTEAGAFGLAAGLLDDTGNLKRGTPTEYRLAGDLLTAAGSYWTAISDLINPQPDRSERYACAKAVARADAYAGGDTILMITSVSSYESAAADAMLAANADLAVVISVRSDEIRVVGRRGGQAGDIHLPDRLFNPLAEEFGGDSGGHAGAGGAKLTTTDEDAVQEQTLTLAGRVVGEELSVLQ